jgi:hypothetical protein
MLAFLWNGGFCAEVGVQLAHWNKLTCGIRLLGPSKILKAIGLVDLPLFCLPPDPESSKLSSQDSQSFRITFCGLQAGSLRISEDLLSIDRGLRFSQDFHLMVCGPGRCGVNISFQCFAGDLRAKELRPNFEWFAGRVTANG